MEDEHRAQKWSFDSFRIIVPHDSVALLEHFFTGLEYQCKINEHGIHALPNASQEDVFQFVLGLFGTPSPMAQGTGCVELIVYHRDDMMSHVADTLSTGLASFVSASGIFCAYPRLTFNHQAMAMNRFPTAQML